MTDPLMPVMQIKIEALERQVTKLSEENERVRNLLTEFDIRHDVDVARADLLAPDPMDDPRVQALVEAGTELLDYCETGNWPSVDPVQKARAALAAMEHDT